MWRFGRAICATRRRSYRRSTPGEGGRGAFGSWRDRARSSVTSTAGKCISVIESASAFPEFHDSGVVKVFLGRAFNVVVGFPGGGGGGQSDAELIGEVECEAEILVHQAQREARDVFAFEQIRRLDIQDTGAGHAGFEDFDKLFALKACAGDKSESFGEGIDLKREDQVHRELDGLAGAVGPEVKPFLAHHAEDG